MRVCCNEQRRWRDSRVAPCVRRLGIRREAREWLQTTVVLPAPDLGASSTAGPYDFWARIQLFQAVAVPFPAPLRRADTCAGQRVPCPRRPAFPKTQHMRGLTRIEAKQAAKAPSKSIRFLQFLSANRALSKHCAGDRAKKKITAPLPGQSPCRTWRRWATSDPKAPWSSGQFHPSDSQSSAKHHAPPWELPVSARARSAVRPSRAAMPAMEARRSKRPTTGCRRPALARRAKRPASTHRSQAAATGTASTEPDTQLFLSGGVKEQT
jgi:hypothetical protein